MVAAPALLLVACACAGACAGPERTAPAGVTVRDSAGVAIVEHSAAFIASLPVWTLDSVPVLRIVADPDPDPDADALAEVQQAVRRPDGRVIVYDVRLRELREYSTGGELLRTLARAGRGPGEIGYITGLQLVGADTVAFIDSNQRRISFLPVTGRSVPSSPFRASTTAPRSECANVCATVGCWPRCMRRGSSPPRPAGRCTGAGSRWSR